MRMIEKIRQNNKNNLELIAVLIYLLVLIVSYTVIYEKGMWVEGFEADFSMIKLLLAVPIIFILYKKNENLSYDFIKFNIKIILLIMFIPISVIYIVRNESTLAYVCFSAEILLIIELVKLLPKIVSKIKLDKIRKIYYKLDFKLISKIICILFWINTIFVLIMCFKYNGQFGFSALDLSKVYEVREKFQLPKYILYLYSFETKFILIFLTGMYLTRKKYKMAALTTLLQMVFYLFKADKIVLFGAFLVILLYFVFQIWDIKKFIPKLVWVLAFLFTLFIILALVNKDIFLGLIVRRMLLVPANLKFCYYQFFSNNPKIGIVGTVLNSVFKSFNHYSDIPYENLISEIYFGKPEMFSNTGFLIEGYARWGYIGFIIIPIIFAIVMHVLNFGAKNNTIIFMCIISTIPILNLNDGYLINSVTFGALLFLCFISLFFRINSLKKEEIEEEDKREKKVVFFVSAANSSHTIKWVNALSNQFTIHLIYCKGHINEIDKINKDVVLHELKYKSPQGYYFNAIELRKLFNEIKPDLINVHYASGYGTLVRISGIKPVLISVWGSDVYDFPKKSLINSYILEKNILYADEVASTSIAMAEELKKEIPDLDKDIFITPFGVDIEMFKNQNHKRDDNFIIGTVKTLEKNYAIDILIKSVEKLKCNLIENNKSELAQKIKCYIYGEGSQRDYLENLIKELKLEDTVFLRGKIPQADVPKALNELNVFCVTSISESFGVAVVEAMSCEIPVVATNTDGFKEVVDDGINGYIVNVNDIDGIATKFEKILNDKNLGQSIGKNGRKKVLEMYDWNKNVDQMSKIYSQMILKKGKNNI